MQSSIAKFKEKYGLDVDFIDMNRAYRLDRVNKLFTTSTVDADSEAAEYQHGLNYLLTAYIRRQIDMDIEKSEYSLGDLDLLEFAEEYEELMQKKHEAGTDHNKERQPRAGLSQNAVLNTIIRKTNEFNKPISEIWADRMLSGKMSLDDFRKLTDAAHDSITRNLVKPSDCTTVNLAHQAMQKFNEKKSVWWMITHPIDAVRQYMYTNTLNQRMEEYRAKDVFFSTITDDESLMRDAFDGVRELKAKQEAANNGSNQKSEPQQSIEVGHKTIIEYGKNSVLRNELAEDICNKLSANGKEVIPALLSMDLTTNLIHCGGSMESVINNAAANGADAKGQVKAVVGQVFDMAYNRFNMLTYNNDADKLASVQIITDEIMKKLPIVSENPEMYGEFANGYVLNNFQEFSEMNLPASAIEEAKNILSPEPEKVNVTEAALTDNTKEVSDIIKEEPSIKGRELSNN